MFVHLFIGYAVRFFQIESWNDEDEDGPRKNVKMTKAVAGPQDTDTYRCFTGDSVDQTVLTYDVHSKSPLLINVQFNMLYIQLIAVRLLCTLPSNHSTSSFRISPQ